jgi:ABC-type sulfate transport system substrate-binding protein
VEANRELLACAKKPAILFYNNYSAHISAPVLQKLVRHGVLVITYSPHTSHIAQVLDVRLFGLLKGSKKFQMRVDGLDADVYRILRFFRAYEIVTASTTIMAAWRKAVFEYENRSMATNLSVNERQIREPSDFRDS